MVIKTPFHPMNSIYYPHGSATYKLLKTLSRLDNIFLEDYKKTYQRGIFKPGVYYSADTIITEDGDES